MIVENVLQRSVISNSGTVDVDNQKSSEDIFDKYSLRECNYYYYTGHNFLLYNYATINLAIFSNETSLDKLSKT